jgi:hypothetical protein
MKKIVCLFLLLGGAAVAQQTPLTVPQGGVAVIDLPNGSAQTIVLDIEQGRFAEQSVGRLTLNARGINFRQGALDSLSATVQDGQFDTVPVDQLKLVTQAFSFDTFELINHRRFLLDKPVNAQVALKLSEASLNRFFSNPKTIERLEKAISKKTGNLLPVRLSDPGVVFLGKNRIRLNLTAHILEAPTPLEMVGRLGVQNGKLALSELALASNGVTLPIDLTHILGQKINEMLDFERLGKNQFVIQAQSMSMVGKALEVKGTAALTRLEFGQ